MEYLTGPGSYGIALHNWYGQQSAIQAVSTEGSGSPVSIPQGTDTSQPHDYGFLWVPATATTKGYAKWYFDHVQVGNTITWNQYNPATPPSPVDGSSAYSVMDARHLYMILGSGPSNPMTVYSVKAWQKSNAANIRHPADALLTTPGGGRRPNRYAQPGRNQDQHRRGKPDHRSGRQSLDPRPVSVEGTADRLQRLRRSGHRAGRPARNSRRQNRPGEFLR